MPRGPSRTVALRWGTLSTEPVVADSQGDELRPGGSQRRHLRRSRVAHRVGHQCRAIRLGRVLPLGPPALPEAGLGSREDEYSSLGLDPDPVRGGRRLDESLDLIPAMWAQRPVHFRGETQAVDGFKLLSKPVQSPHPPIWVGARWPNLLPFRRSARFDGVMPTHSGYGHDSFMSPVELRQIVDFVVSCRVERGGFDVVMEGMSDSAEDLNEIFPNYGEAGLTRWIEKLGWWRGGIDAAFERILAGPPRSSCSRVGELASRHHQISGSDPIPGSLSVDRSGLGPGVRSASFIGNFGRA